VPAAEEEAEVVLDRQEREQELVVVPACGGVVFHT